MAAHNPFNDKKKEEAMGSNSIDYNAVIIFDRDNTLVEDVNENADDTKAINRDQLEILFRYFILKKIPVGFLSTGGSVSDYGGDERLSAIRSLYPPENFHGYFIGRGMKYLHSVHMPEACQPNSLEVTLNENSNLKTFTQNSDEFKNFFVEFVSKGQYNPETHELSYTDEKRNATFNVKINPEYTFKIELVDKEQKPGLVLTINVHELLKGGYEEIGAAKGKIFGCLKILAEMHILPVLDRDMSSVGIIAITGPDDYARVNISRVVVVDDEDVIIQNLGRAGLNAILADTEARYQSLCKDVIYKIEQDQKSIEKCQEKIGNAPKENKKVDLLLSCIEVLKSVPAFYQEKVAAEQISGFIEKLKKKSLELREFDSRYLKTDADRLDRWVQRLEEHKAEHDQYSALVESDIMNFTNRAHSFKVDVDAMEKEMQGYISKIDESRAVLLELEKPAQKVTNEYLNKLAQHFGFQSFKHLKLDNDKVEAAKKNEAFYAQALNLTKNLILSETNKHLIVPTNFEELKTNSAEREKGYARRKIVHFFKQNIAGDTFEKDAILFLKKVEAAHSLGEVLDILSDASYDNLQSAEFFDTICLHIDKIYGFGLGATKNSLHLRLVTKSNVSSSCSSGNISGSSSLFLSNSLSQREHKLKEVKEMLCKKFENELHDKIEAAAGWSDIETLLAKREMNNYPVLNKEFFKGIYEEIDHIYELSKGRTQEGVYTQIEIIQEKGTSNLTLNGK